MTVCEKVPEMLLITGPAIILGRHRGVPEPIITRRGKTVRKEKALPSPAHCPPLPPSCSGKGSLHRGPLGPRESRSWAPAWAFSLLFLL